MSSLALKHRSIESPPEAGHKRDRFPFSEPFPIAEDRRQDAQFGFYALFVLFCYA
jgi:hypothetical protein